MAFAGGVVLFAGITQTAQAHGRYTVRQGDTLTSIARKLGVPLDCLTRANKAGDHLRIGQVLVVPDASGKPRQGRTHQGSEPAVSRSERYVVRAGDSLYEIAKRHGVSVQALARANGAGENLQIGQVLVIPSKAKPTVSTASTGSKTSGPRESASGGAWHTVAPGETLWSIAKKHGVSPEALAKANRAGDRLQIGQRLRIPGRSTTPNKAVAKTRKKVPPSRTQVRPPLDEIALEEEAWSPEDSGKESEPGQAVSKSVRALVVRTALAYRGGYYVRGGSGPRGFDCSGFTRYVFRKAAKINLPHTSSGQFCLGKKVSASDLAPGDLVFFRRGGGVGHVGVYIGDGQFVHASNPRRGIRVDSINHGSYRRRFVGARRILPAE